MICCIILTIIYFHIEIALKVKSGKITQERAYCVFIKDKKSDPNNFKTIFGSCLWTDNSLR